VLSISIAAEAASTPAGQAAFLTAVVTGTRCFGQVTVDGALAEPRLVPWPVPAKTLAEAALYFGAGRESAPNGARKILVGSALEAGQGWAVRAVWNGW